MSLSAADLQDLQATLADRLYVQISVDGASRGLAHEVSVKLWPIVRNRCDQLDRSTKKTLPSGAVEARLERFELPTL